MSAHVTSTVLSADEYFDRRVALYDSRYDAFDADGHALRARLEAVCALVGIGRGDLLDAGMGGVGELADRRRAADLARQAVAGHREAGAQLLDVARDADHPAAIAEVALDLARDRRHRERGESHVAVEVEALDRLHQAERRNLLQVVERFSLVGVAPGKRAGERQRALDQLDTCLFVSVFVPAPE